MCLAPGLSSDEREERPRVSEYLLPLPMCLRVFSMVEFLFTLDSRPRQKRLRLLDGSVNPSTSTLREAAWKVSPTRLFSS